MMYQQKFVGVIKVKSKILREHDNVVTIPFGEEYSIFLKNLNSVKAVVSITIDGQDVLQGKRIIVNPNSSAEVEGFVDGMKVLNKFKFIQKTKEIQDYRGDKIDDGIVRIEYKFEKIIEKKIVITEHKEYYQPYDRWHYHYTGPWYGSFTSTLDSSSYTTQDNCLKGNDIPSHGSCTGGITSSLVERGVTGEDNLGSNINYCSSQAFAPKMDFVDAPLPDEGITVRGSYSNQSFRYGYVNELEENSSVITLKLVGTNSKGIKIEEPVIVTKKIKCPTCGRASRSSAKFCRNCGTSLV